MRNHSIALFNLDGAPMLRLETRASGPCFSVRDSQDEAFMQGVDFYTPTEDAARLARAVEAFNEIMREPVAQAEAAE